MRLRNLALLIAIGVPVQAAGQAGDVWGRLAVPGGVDAARRNLGLRGSDDRPDALLLLDYADRYAALRNRQAAETAARYFAGAGAGLGAPTVPLPLPRFWSAFGRAEDGSLLAAIVAREELALLYRGLASLDEETLGYLDGAPALTRQWLEDFRPFSVFGRSLRIHAGVVVLPGGDAARDVWHRLVPRSPDDPAAFTRELLRRDDGRMAYFFDAVSRLDPLRQAAVLGAGLEAPARDAHVERVYRVFRAFEPIWNARDEPFQMRAFDPAVAVAFTGFRADRTIGPDWWPSLLERVSGSDDWPDRPEQTQRRLNARPADAVWLLDWIFDRPGDARRRFELVRYLQRQFPDSTMEHAFAVETALRTFHEMPALALSLERMGVRDAAAIGALGRAGRQATRSGSAEDALPAVRRLQLAVGWLEQAHRHRPVDEPAVTRLLASLAVVPQGREGLGGTAGWLIDELLPSLGVRTARASEAAMLEAMLSGSGAGTVEWEGLTYDLRPDRAALRAASAIRAAQTGPRLDDLVRLVRSGQAIAAPPPSLAATAEVAADIRASLPGLRMLVEQRSLDEGVLSDLERVARSLERIERERDLDRATREHDRLMWAIDGVTDVVGQQILYALAAAPTARPAMLYADGWRRHVMDARGPTDARPWATLVWQPADSSADVEGDAAVHGSLLALDVALAEAQLRDLDDAELLAPPRLAAPDRRAMIEALLLSRPAAREPAGEGRRHAAAIAAGRRFVAGWTGESSPSMRAALEAAGVDPHRVNLLLHADVAGAANADADDGAPVPAERWLGVMEIHGLGHGGGLPGWWGAAGRSLDGCLCLQAIEPWQLRWLGDRAGSGFAGAAVMDLSLRLAEHLEAMGLPESLVPWLLRPATREWIDRVWQIVPSDTAALAEFPARLPIERLDAYLLSLVADGVLVVTGEVR